MGTFCAAAHPGAAQQGCAADGCRWVVNGAVRPHRLTPCPGPGPGSLACLMFHPCSRWATHPVGGVMAIRRRPAWRRPGRGHSGSGREHLPPNPTSERRVRSCPGWR